MSNEKEITQDGPFDIVECWEASDGTTLGLMRTHRDQVAAYKSSRKVPETFVLCLLQNNLMGAISALVAAREIEGLLGAVRFMVAELPASAFGSPEAVENWLRRRELTDGQKEV